MAKILAPFLAATVLIGAGPALAETAAARLACAPSVVRLCPAEAFSGDREGAKACLLRNLSRASRACQAAVRLAQYGDGAAAARKTGTDPAK